MDIYTKCTDRLPFTYLIGWSELNLWYYGVRYAKKCNPSDIMKTYYTSSRRVHDLIIEQGMPDVVEVRRTFDTIDGAKTWEIKVLRRLNVVNKKIY